MHNQIYSFIQQFRSQGPLVYLDSQSSDHPSAEYSYIAGKPEAVIMARGNTITVKSGDEEDRQMGNPFDALKAFIAKHGDWLFGYFGYDLKNYIEDLESGNSDPVGAPDMFFMVPSIIIKFHKSGSWFEIVKGKNHHLIDKKYDRRQEKNGELKLGRLVSGVSRDQYLERIKIAQESIYEGDFYEINLSHQLRASFEGDPFALFKKMKQRGPVPFAAYIEMEDLAICSQSPERFLSKKGKNVYSQPIKGTRKRSGNNEEDLSLLENLQHSEKDRAENLMIVDLVRNDLGRIARTGTVSVSDLFEIQSFDTVHQMVSTVRAETDLDDPIDIIKACFPMGSMTGAPKISAMQAIEKLENYKRGIYSGAIGYITPGHDFDFNVVIRTGIIKNNHIYYPVGGAITSDSDPGDEWEETLVKSKALTEAVD